MIKTKLYDQFHRFTRAQSRIINHHNFTYNIIISILRQYIHNKQSILDIGCGAGTISLYLASTYNKSKVTGIDISSIAIAACQESAKRLQLNNIIYRQMDFPTKIPKEKYDIIVCLEVIEHLEDDYLVIKKMYELLNDNGIIILSTPSVNSPLYKMGFAKSFDKRVGHLRRYNLNNLIRMFNNEQLTVISVHKTEGLLRNFLFINTTAGKLVRFIKFPLTLFVNSVDHILLSIFGEADIFVIAKKI